MAGQREDICKGKAVTPEPIRALLFHNHCPRYNALYSPEEEDQISGEYQSSALAYRRRIHALAQRGGRRFPRAGAASHAESPNRCGSRWCVQHGSTATGTDLEGRGYTIGDGDLRGWTWVDVVPVVCKQGVRGLSPLSSTGQKPNSNSRAKSTATKYSNRDRVRCRTRVRVGPCPPRRRRADPGSWAALRATGQEERLSGARSCLPGGQRALCRICCFKAGSCRSGRGSANGKLFPSPKGEIPRNAS